MRPMPRRHPLRLIGPVHGFAPRLVGCPLSRPVLTVHSPVLPVTRHCVLPASGPELRPLPEVGAVGGGSVTNDHERSWDVDRVPARARAGTPSCPRPPARPGPGGQTAAQRTVWSPGPLTCSPRPGHRGQGSGPAWHTGRRGIRKGTRSIQSLVFWPAAREATQRLRGQAVQQAAGGISPASTAVEGKLGRRFGPPGDAADLAESAPGTAARTTAVFTLLSRGRAVRWRWACRGQRPAPPSTAR